MYIENGWLKWQVPLFCYRVKNLSFTGLSLTSSLNQDDLRTLEKQL